MSSGSNVTGNISSPGDGSDYYTLTQIIIIAIVTAILSVTTVIGNIMVMISFKIDKQLQTISNYFLFR
ncbi:unnamed protein product [Nezara viridula]|uniref:Uncharacterized protein n=1 Tax=Nezara viridula TaxID=85310 RepID=A0A9P0E0N5_NEZVI|nr:unnamed protein product [Nezara viridula]